MTDALAEYQRAMVRVSYDLEPSASDLALLGDEVRFVMYRSMVRSRLEAMAGVAFRGAREAVGEGRFSESFARYLQAAPPRSAFIREVVAAFADFARNDAELLAPGPSQLADLLRFEQAKWCVAYEPAAQVMVGEGGVREFDFAGALVLNPVLRCLALEHAVHQPDTPQRPTLLFVYRPPQSDQARWYAADPFFFRVVERSLATADELVSCVREVCTEQGHALDEERVEQLSGALTVALERGVVLGSR